MRIDRRRMAFHYFHNSEVQFTKIVRELKNTGGNTTANVKTLNNDRRATET